MDRGRFKFVCFVDPLDTLDTLVDCLFHDIGVRLSNLALFLGFKFQYIRPEITVYTVYLCIEKSGKKQYFKTLANVSQGSICHNRKKKKWHPVFPFK